MVRVLSVQSDGMGHKVYCGTLRRCFSTFPDIDLTACWAREGRSLSTRILTRILEQRVPWLGDHQSNLDYLRFRSEYAHGRMSRLLIERKLKEARSLARPFDVLHLHTHCQAITGEKLFSTIPTVISLDMSSFQVSLEPGRRNPGTLRPNIRLERRAFDQAAHLVTWSEWARQSLIDLHGCPPEKVTTITPGAQLSGFPAPREQENALPRLLFIGHDFTRKGGWDVLKVFTENFTGDAELHFVTNEELGSLPKNVFVHHNVMAYTPAWYALLHQADIFVLPTYSEGFGLVFQEAAAAGLALVGSGINAIPEMIEEGVNGLLVEPGNLQLLQDALSSLIFDRPRCLAMRQASRRIALERFDAEKNFRRMADLFVKLTAS